MAVGKKPCPGCGGPLHRGNNFCALCSAKTKQGEAIGQRQSESVSVSDDRCEITKTTNRRVRSLDDLIRVCEIDTGTWAVERYVCNKWDMGSVPRATGSDEAGWKRPTAVPVVTELYQVKVWLKRKGAVIAARNEIADLLRNAKRLAPSLERATRAARPAAGNILELSIPDLHLGKLAWGKETGWENYDAKIAATVFEDALGALIQRTRGHRFDYVLFPVGNDLLNADNREDSTTAGTAQDVDARFQKTFGIARRMITDAIHRLRVIAPVRVVMVPGNHDTLSVWHLGDSLECLFHKCPDVTIDNAPTMRKYHQFGKVMLMFTHGDKGKRLDYPLLMATEQPQMFGATVHREAHTGHIHQVRTEEQHGVKVRISPALCPPDAWHAERAFVGATRGAEAFVWHREDGLIATAHYTVPTTTKGARSDVRDQKRSGNARRVRRHS